MSLIAKNVSVEVDSVQHLSDLSFEMSRGRLYTVLGRTMSGKTSLFRAISGLLKIDSGELSLDNRSIKDEMIWRRDVAMVYQQFINYPHLNVSKNIAFPLKKAGLNKQEIELRVHEYLEKVGMVEFKDRKVSELSGGQQQRVALARALARKSNILLLDEPLVNLDYKLREQLREEFKSLFSDQGNAVVLYATTDPAEAMMLGDEVLIMHEGRLLQKGTPEEVFENPKSTLVAQIINEPPMNIFQGGISGGKINLPGGVSFDVPKFLTHLNSGNYLFGTVSPAIHLDPRGSLSAKVTYEEVSGSESFIYVDSQIGPLVIQIAGIHSFRIGESVAFNLDQESFHAFDLNGKTIGTPSGRELAK